MTRAAGSWLSALGAAVLALLLAAPNTVSAQVRFERTGFRMTSIGERITVSGRLFDARRRPVATTRVRWRIADPSIASVSPQGVVVSRKTGNTRLWAVAGQDSASALIVVDQWAAKFDFAPALVRLDAVGAKAPLRISVRDAEGHFISEQNRRPASCRSLNETIAVLSPSGEVTARSNGTTWIRCTDRGIADSARIEVRQRPARVTIADKSGIGSKIVGDTFRIRLNALDRTGDAIRDPQATWASLNPTIVSVDPSTGSARSLGGGTARIVAQVGDISDTVTVAVSPGIGQPVPANADTVITTEIVARVARLDIDPLIPREGDQASISLRAHDPSGAEVTNPAVTLRSSDTAVFVVLSGLRVQAKKAGSAYVVGRFGTAVDSALVTVRSATAVAQTDTAAERREAAAFKRPTVPVDSLRAIYASAADSARKQMFEGSAVARGASGRFVSLSGAGGQMAYTFSDSVAGMERRTGVLIGGTLEAAPFRRLKLTLDFRKGDLKSQEDAGGNDIRVTEASGDLTFLPWQWLGLRGGYVVRALREGDPDPTRSIAVQQWSFSRGSVLIRLPFVGGQVTTLAGISVLPTSVYTGTNETPDPFGLAGEAGIEVNTNWISAGLTYSVEKLSITPLSGGAPRVDQFSSIRLRLGLQRGR